MVKKSSTFSLKFSCFPHFNWFCAVESNESNTPSESKNHKDLKVEDLSSYNNNADIDDNGLPVDLLAKLQRLVVHDGRVCTPQDDPKVII